MRVPLDTKRFHSRRSQYSLPNEMFLIRSTQRATFFQILVILIFTSFGSLEIVTVTLFFILVSHNNTLRGKILPHTAKVSPPNSKRKRPGRWNKEKQTWKVEQGETSACKRNKQKEKKRTVMLTLPLMKLMPALSS